MTDLEEIPEDPQHIDEPFAFISDEDMAALQLREQHGLDAMRTKIRLNMTVLQMIVQETLVMLDQIVIPEDEEHAA